MSPLPSFVLYRFLASSAAPPEEAKSPVVLEPALLNQAAWGNGVAQDLGKLFFVDCTSDDKVGSAAAKLAEILANRAKST